MIELSYGGAAAAAGVCVTVGWLLCYYVWAWVAAGCARATSSAAYYADRAARLLGSVVIVGGVCWLLWRVAVDG